MLEGLLLDPPDDPIQKPKSRNQRSKALLTDTPLSREAERTDRKDVDQKTAIKNANQDHGGQNALKVNLFWFTRFDFTMIAALKQL